MNKTLGQGDESLLSEIRYALYSTRIKEFGNPVINIPSEKSVSIQELWIRQFLNSRFNNHNLLKQIYQAKVTGIPFSKGIPMEWIDVLDKHSIPIDKRKIKFHWRIQGLKYVLYVLYKILTANRIPNNLDLSQYIYCEGLTRESIPINKNQENIFNWIKSNFGVTNKSIEFHHSVNSISFNSRIKKSPLKVNCLYYNSSKQLFRILIFAFKQIIQGLKYPVIHIILFEILKTKSILYNKQIQYRRYFFNNSDYMYRPIWTYFVERTKREIWFYFYSTNNYEIEKSTEKLTPNKQHNGWALSTWQRLLFWNDQHQTLYKIHNHHPLIESRILTPPPFITYNKSLEKRDKINKPVIALFDVQPYEYEHLILFGLSNNYYTFQTTKKFIEDLIDISKKLNAKILFKQKRSYPPTVSKEYVKFINSIQNPDFEIINSSESAYSIITIANYVVSMPFTSTHQLSKSLNIPSCYYDSSGTLSSKEDLIITKDELYEALKKTFHG